MFVRLFVRLAVSLVIEAHAAAQATDLKLVGISGVSPAQAVLSTAFSGM